jgi:hypothetical protein
MRREWRQAEFANFGKRVETPARQRYRAACREADLREWRLNADPRDADGLCHHCIPPTGPGEHAHECGRVAAWIGMKASGFRRLFCEDCRHTRYQTWDYVTWLPIPPDKMAAPPVPPAAPRWPAIREHLTLGLACAIGVPALVSQIFNGVGDPLPASPAAVLTMVRISQAWEAPSAAWLSALLIYGALALVGFAIGYLSSWWRPRRRKP